MMFRLMRFQIIACILVLLINSSCSYKKKLTARNIQLPVSFASGMVIQTTPNTVIYGTAEPYSKLAVRISNYMRLVTTQENGKWRAVFPEIVSPQTFVILIEGKDTSLAITNVVAGHIIIITGNGSGNLHSLDSLSPTTSVGLLNRDIRMFIPGLCFDTLPCPDFKEGRWLPFAEALKNAKIAQILQSTYKTFPNDKSPIGIMYLISPETGIASWKAGTKKPDAHINTESQLPDSLRHINDSILNIILRMKGSCINGIKKGAHRLWYNDENWTLSSLPINLGSLDQSVKKRIIYLRKNIMISNKYLVSNFTLELGKISGEADIYFNNRKIKNVHDNTEAIRISIPDTLVKAWKNVLAIRFFCTDTSSGIFGDRFLCYNQDNSFNKDIRDEWKYSSTLEDDFPIILRAKDVCSYSYPYAFNSIISPMQCLNFEYLVWIAETSDFSDPSKYASSVHEIFRVLPPKNKKTIVCQSPDSKTYKKQSDLFLNKIRELSQQENIQIMRIDE